MTRQTLPPELLAELSALLDDEVDSDRAAELRERMAREPELAVAFEALRAVDRGLRATPRAEISSELAARMRARFDAEREQGTVVALRKRRPGAPRTLRRVAVAAATLAATVALALLLRTQIARGPQPHVAPRPLPPEPPIEAPLLPQEEAPELLAPAPLPAPPTPETSDRPAPIRESTQPIVLPAPAPGQIAERTPAALPDAIESASDEELALALELGVLGAATGSAEDLAIIEALEFVERLRDEDLEGRGRG